MGLQKRAILLNIPVLQLCFSNLFTFSSATSFFSPFFFFNFIDSPNCNHQQTPSANTSPAIFNELQLRKANKMKKKRMKKNEKKKLKDETKAAKRR